jgi:hypothetical protein
MKALCAEGYTSRKGQIISCCVPRPQRGLRCTFRPIREAKESLRSFNQKAAYPLFHFLSLLRVKPLFLMKVLTQKVS